VKKRKPEKLLRRAHLALQLGVSGQRIDALVKAKKLKRRADKMFDLLNPVNAKYLAARNGGISSTPSGTPPAGPTIEPPVPEIPRSEIERRKALGQLEKLRLQNMKAAGSLVTRPSVFAFASHIVSILNSEFLSLGQRLSTELAAIARKAPTDDEAAVALDAFLQPELYAVVKHATAATQRFVRELYDEATGEVAGPIQVVAALEELRAMLDKVIAEVKEKEKAA
jgi:hypothetical protein